MAPSTVTARIRSRLGLGQRAADAGGMDALLGAFPRPGSVVWLGLRPGRLAPVRVVERVEARAGVGLVGDHFSGRPDATRQVTLVQAEHLAVLGARLGEPPVDPARLRRNVVVAGINLLALRDRRFRIGAALFEGSGVAPPCSRMEQALGPGGYNAMRGHGGLTARVIEGGLIRLGDAVLPT